MLPRLRIVLGILVLVAALSAVNHFRGPHLFAPYDKVVMVVALGSTMFFVHYLHGRTDDFARTAGKPKLSTREYVRTRPLATVIWVLFALSLPFVFDWIRGKPADWWIDGIYEAVLVFVMIRQWIRDRPNPPAAPLK